MRDMDEIISLVSEFLDKEGIKYVIVGGLAAIFYGIPRMTMDLDLIIQMPENKRNKFIEFLNKNDFFVDKWDLEQGFKDRSHSTIQDKNSLLRLDIKGVYTKFDKETLERRVAIRYKGKKLHITSPEDTIANKLLFGREQDIKDSEGIYVRQLEKLDMKLLENRCKELNVWKEFLNMKKRVEKYLNERK